MECLESHQKIQFFDLWELDDLLLQLLTRGGGRTTQRKKSTSTSSATPNNQTTTTHDTPTTTPQNGGSERQEIQICTSSNVQNPEQNEKSYPDSLFASPTPLTNPLSNQCSSTPFSPHNDPFLSSFSPFTMSPSMPPSNQMPNSSSMFSTHDSCPNNQEKDPFLHADSMGKSVPSDFYASSLPSTESQLFEG